MSKKNLTPEERELIGRLKDFCEHYGESCAECPFDNLCSDDDSHKSIGDLEIKSVIKTVYEVED